MQPHGQRGLLTGKRRESSGIPAAEPPSALSRVAVSGFNGVVIDAPHIVLAHDWLVGMRGGERVLDRLARLYGPTDLYTLVADGQPHSGAIDGCNIITSPLQRLPGATGRCRRWYLPLYRWAVERLRVPACDLLISTSSAAIKSIKPPPGVPHLCYCHSPARYIWEQTEDYAVGAGAQWRALGLKAIRKRYQYWDRSTADRVTRFLANSAHTAARIRRCYGRDASVVYPPVRTQYFTVDPDTPREDWFLVVAALEPYKRTDIVIEAANRAGFSLKVAGTGSQFSALAAMAGPNVTMLGRVDDASLRELYRRARALVFPQTEDFGIIPVEAQASGCPVIAYKAGGALETVTEATGVYFERQDADAVIEAVETLQSRSISADRCRANALRFAEEVFDRAIHKHVSELLGESATTADATAEPLSLSEPQRA